MKSLFFGLTCVCLYEIFVILKFEFFFFFLLYASGFFFKDFLVNEQMKISLAFNLIAGVLFGWNLEHVKFCFIVAS